jgi:hypothetical protein
MLAQNPRTALFVGTSPAAGAYNSKLHRPSTGEAEASAMIPDQFGVIPHFVRDGDLFSAGQPSDRVVCVLSGILRPCKHISGRRRIVDFQRPAELYRLAHSLAIPDRRHVAVSDMQARCDLATSGAVGA